MKRYATVRVTTVQTITINLDNFEADWATKPTDKVLTEIAVGHRGTKGDRSGDFVRVECGEPMVLEVSKVERCDEGAEKAVPAPRKGRGSY